MLRCPRQRHFELLNTRNNKNSLDVEDFVVLWGSKESMSQFDAEVARNKWKIQKIVASFSVLLKTWTSVPPWSFVGPTRKAKPLYAGWEL